MVMMLIGLEEEKEGRMTGFSLPLISLHCPSHLVPSTLPLEEAALKQNSL